MSMQFEVKMQCEPWDEAHPLMGTADMIHKADAAVIDEHTVELSQGQTCTIYTKPAGKHLRILDWKSGWKEGNHGQQMAAYACLGFFSDPTIQSVTVYIVYLRHGTIETLTFDRKQIADWIIDVTKRIIERKNIFVTGGHCDWCIHVNDCTARKEWMKNALAVWDLPKGDLRAVENLPEVLDKVSAIENACKNFRHALKAEIKTNGPIPLKDGQEMRLEEQTREVILADVAWDSLWLEHGLELLQAVEIKKGKLLDLVASKAPPRGKGEAKADCMEILADLEAIEEQPWGERIVIAEKEKDDGAEEV